MEIIKISSNIENIIKEIGKCRREIESKGKNRAKTLMEYDKALAVCMATLRNDKNYMLAGKEYDKPPVSIIEKLAKGICAQQRYNLEIAEASYKASIKNLEALMAQLNAYQSLFRYMEYEVKASS